MEASQNSSKTKLNPKILCWIVEFAAKHGLQSIIQAIVQQDDCDEEIVESMREEMSLCTLRHFASSNEKEITTTNLVTALELLEQSEFSPKDVAEYEKSICFLRAKLLLKTLTSEGFDSFEQMKAAIINQDKKSQFDIVLDRHLSKIEKLYSKKPKKAIEIAAKLEEKKYKWEDLSQSMKEYLDKFAPVSISFLESIEQDIDQGNYVPTSEKIDSQDLLKAFPNSEKEWKGVWKQTDPHVKKFVKERNQELQQKDKPEVQANKGKAAATGPARVTPVLDKLRQTTRNFVAQGGDPLPEAIAKARNISKNVARTLEWSDNDSDEFEEDEEKENDHQKKGKSKGNQKIDSFQLPTPKPSDLFHASEYFGKSVVRKGTLRPRRRWTPLEVDRLIKGIAEFGVGSWKRIHEKYDFGDRTTVDLKDKFRVLERSNPDGLIAKIEEEKAHLVERNAEISKARKREREAEREQEIAEQWTQKRKKKSQDEEVEEESDEEEEGSDEEEESNGKKEVEEDEEEEEVEEEESDDEQSIS